MELKANVLDGSFCNVHDEPHHANSPPPDDSLPNANFLPAADCLANDNFTNAPAAEFVPKELKANVVSISPTANEELKPNPLAAIVSPPTADCGLAKPVDEALKDDVLESSPHDVHEGTHHAYSPPPANSLPTADFLPTAGTSPADNSLLAANSSPATDSLANDNSLPADDASPAEVFTKELKTDFVSISPTVSEELKPNPPAAIVSPPTANCALAKNPPPADSLPTAKSFPTADALPAANSFPTADALPAANTLPAANSLLAANALPAANSFLAANSSPADGSLANDNYSPAPAIKAVTEELKANIASLSPIANGELKTKPPAAIVCPPTTNCPPAKSVEKDLKADVIENSLGNFVGKRKK
ncbi:hypothetical protein PtA15_17A115 [Puccinia triticina]|uniref:Uncharacterized protein n=1 Tax=Puccinia triticina TaxID=208348 RepID=A0ABY7D4U0_9BASI|nr:uncharacterized protein PtA15_17A115 [Puccinia triticina]WAQ92633.1 hypothetical protein PtA15_17A115 [Puccinia triticina]